MRLLAWLWLALLPLSAQAESWQAPLAALLHEVDTARHVEGLGPQQLRDKEQVKARLAELSALDQKVRRFWIDHQRDADAAGQHDEFMMTMNEVISDVDAYDTAQLKRLLRVYDWFTIDEFGPTADESGWLLVQHADLDPAFQKEVLARLARLYVSGRTSRSNYAFLYDRVAVAEGRAQRYGTQGACAKGRWTPDASEDPGLLDERRAAMGLEPIARHQATYANCP